MSANVCHSETTFLETVFRAIWSWRPNSVAGRVEIVGPLSGKVILKDLRGLFLCGALPGGGKGVNLWEHQVGVTARVIFSTKNDYIFIQIVPLNEFLDYFVCKVTFVNNSRGLGAQARLSEPLTYWAGKLLSAKPKNKQVKSSGITSNFSSKQNKKQYKYYFILLNYEKIKSPAKKLKRNKGILLWRENVGKQKFGFQLTLD